MPIALSTIPERVAEGVAFLDERDPDWWRADVERAIDLDTLNIMAYDMCVLGQRCPLETLTRNAGVADPDELSWLDRTEAYRLNLGRLTDGTLLQGIALTEWAADRGFTAEADEFDALTAEWARVITERRAAQEPLTATETLNLALHGAEIITAACQDDDDPCEYHGGEGEGSEACAGCREDEAPE